MTDATAVQQLMRERQVYSPAVVRQPNLMTLMSQAAAGFIAGNFVLILAVILLVPDRSNVAAVFFVPLLVVFGAPVGILAGLLIWAGSQLVEHGLNKFNRAGIGVVSVALLWLFFAVVFSWSQPPLFLLLWLLAFIFVPGIAMGLVTGSRLRVWRELVRTGDPVGPVLKAFAAISGMVLRVTVVLFFMVCCIALISILQSSYYQRIDRVWVVILFAHFTAALVLLFVRMKAALLLPLALIAIVPVVVRLFTPPELWMLIPYVAIGYLVLWVVFVLTRWRQTQGALSFLDDEIHYYLID